MSTALNTIIALMVHNAPYWLENLRSTILVKSQEVVTDKGKELVAKKGDELISSIFQLDRKEQIHHLEQALRNATERGLTSFTTLAERDLYKDVLGTLMQMDPEGKELQMQILQLFSYSDTPDLSNLNDKYNRKRQLTALARHESYTDIDTTPYLTSFFNALISELYADPYFKQQMRDVLMLRATKSMQQSLLDIVVILKQIDEALEDNYTTEQLARDIELYTNHVERTLHNLKIVGIVPKDKNKDPELEGIFVPLRIMLETRADLNNDQPDSIVTALEQHPYLVLLGGPGSGKSTSVRYLAWSHAAANWLANQSVASTSSLSLLSGHPLPLRIELRRLSEERRHNNYDFLSFATEVLLKREGIEIDQRMFKELLTRRRMLLLFDGLDEVVTTDERVRLIGEIEHFTLRYPGNRVIVTSRPVGYDFAHFDNQLFSHAYVQPFNDAQIRQFLQNWYACVLGLSTIPKTEQQELDLLIKILQGSKRLHKLAENPLLLTVITQLHRYERLPDKRVLIYDRCAKLLLETWVQTKGKDIRWKEMKMVEEDQYACVAHLGFVLHKRSQEEKQDDMTKNADDITSDVTTRVMLQEIELFLKSRNLMVEVSQQRTEAKLFIDLMKIEAGLIVERGTEENDEALYGFVHRTFQEYFAAADVYERFQQAIDVTIVNDFLIEHLHDPHWREVILLLLGKLKSRPVTNILSQIIQGKIKSHRSLGTHIVQQDLFFACDCLIEEIAVENKLVEMIISCLGSVVKNSAFPTQRELDFVHFQRTNRWLQTIAQE